MPPTADVNSQKNDPAFKPPPRIEAGSSREKSTTPSTPYRLVVPFPVGQTSQGTSQGASQSTSTSQGASQGVDAMHDIEITSPMYIANIDVRTRNEQQLNRTGDEQQLNRSRDEREVNRARDEQQLNRARDEPEVNHARDERKVNRARDVQQLNRARDKPELNRARDEPELNCDREGDRDREGERNRAEGDGAEGDRTPATVDHRPLVPKQPIDKVETYLMTKDFNYAMTVLDDKINSLYRLCRYIGDQQQNMADSLRKLVALDELSEQFWNVSYLIYYTTNLF